MTKMTESVRSTLLAALKNYGDDSLERAEWAFRGMTDEQMAQEHGRSGQTRREVLDGYREVRRRRDEAISWVKEQ